jgi:hypothetical protein
VAWVFSHKSFLTKSFSPISWKTIEVPSLPSVSGVVRGGGFRKQRDLYDWSQQTYNLTRLHQQDQEVTELLVGLVTQGFFDGNR